MSVDPHASWFMASIRISDLDELYEAVRSSGVGMARDGNRATAVQSRPFGAGYAGAAAGASATGAGW